MDQNLKYFQKPKKGVLFSPFLSCVSSKGNHYSDCYHHGLVLPVSELHGIIQYVLFSGFFHSTLCLWMSPMFLCVLVIHFELLHCISLYEYSTTINPFSCWCNFGLFPVWGYYIVAIKILFSCFLKNKLPLFLLDVCLRVGLLGYRVDIHLEVIDIVKHFTKMVIPIYTSTSNAWEFQLLYILANSLSL